MAVGCSQSRLSNIGEVAQADSFPSTKCPRHFSNSFSSDRLDGKKEAALDVWYLHLNRPRFVEGSSRVDISIFGTPYSRLDVPNQDHHYPTAADKKYLRLTSPTISFA